MLRCVFFLCVPLLPYRKVALGSTSHVGAPEVVPAACLLAHRPGMSTVQLGRGAWSCAHARSAHRGAEPNAEPFPSSSGCAGSQGCSLRGTAAGLLPADVCVYPPLLRFVIPCISLIRQRPSWSPRANAALAPHRPERPGTGGINASRLTPPRARGALVSCTPHLQCEAARRAGVCGVLAGCRAPPAVVWRGAAFCCAPKYQTPTCTPPGPHLDTNPDSFRRDPELCVCSAATS